MEGFRVKWAWWHVWGWILWIPQAVILLLAKDPDLKYVMILLSVVSLPGLLLSIAIIKERDSRRVWGMAIFAAAACVALALWIWPLGAAPFDWTHLGFTLLSGIAIDFILLGRYRVKA